MPQSHSNLFTVQDIVLISEAIVQTKQYIDAAMDNAMSDGMSEDNPFLVSARQMLNDYTDLHLRLCSFMDEVDEMNFNPSRFYLLPVIDTKGGEQNGDEQQ